MLEIVAGDFGMGHKFIVKKMDLNGCVAKLYVWQNSTYLIEGKPCGDVVYDSAEDESYCYYVVADGDFPSSAAIDGKKTEYDARVAFTRAGYKEHDLGFKWLVHPGPPAGGS